MSFYNGKQIINKIFFTGIIPIGLHAAFKICKAVFAIIKNQPAEISAAPFAEATIFIIVLIILDLIGNAIDLKIERKRMNLH